MATATHIGAIHTGAGATRIRTDIRTGAAAITATILTTATMIRPIDLTTRATIVMIPTAIIPIGIAGLHATTATPATIATKTRPAKPAIETRSSRFRIWRHLAGSTARAMPLVISRGALPITLATPHQIQSPQIQSPARATKKELAQGQLFTALFG